MMSKECTNFIKDPDDSKSNASCRREIEENESMPLLSLQRSNSYVSINIPTEQNESTPTGTSVQDSMLPPGNETDNQQQIVPPTSNDDQTKLSTEIINPAEPNSETQLHHAGKPSSSLIQHVIWPVKHFPENGESLLASLCRDQSRMFENGGRGVMQVRHEHYGVKGSVKYMDFFDRDQEDIDEQAEVNPEDNTTEGDTCSQSHGARIIIQLFDYILLKDNAPIEWLLKDGVNPNNIICKLSHVTACHIAAYCNSDLLQLLVKYNADKNRMDKLGRTPLHVAAWAGNNRSIAILLELPNDLQSKMGENECTEMMPETEEEIKALRILKPEMSSMVEVRCHWDGKSKVDLTWLRYINNYLAYSDLYDCENAWAYITLEISCGWTPLHAASCAAHHSTTRLLLAAGADPNSKSMVGQTALDVAGAACFVKKEKLDVDKYVKTINTLIEFGGELNTLETTPDKSWSALHTAVELGSVDATEALLRAGAPLVHRNERGNTPLHECVSKRDLELLKVLAKHIQLDGTEPSVIDVTNSSGHTALHMAILASWETGVCEILDAGADATLEDGDGNTAVHIAACVGDGYILSVVIKAAKARDALFYNKGRGEAPLVCALRSGHMNTALMILYLCRPEVLTLNSYISEIGSQTCSLETEDLSNVNMILHAVAEFDTEGIVVLFIRLEKSLQDLVDYRCPYLMNLTPTELAAQLNRFNTFKWLLKITINRAKEKNLTFDPTLLDFVIKLNREDMFCEIIKDVPNAVGIAIEKGHYPLHHAIRAGNRNVILQLIDNGADLSQDDDTGNKAIDMFFEHLSKPKEFMESIFDRYIQTNDNPIENRNCEITVDYRVLIPEMDPMNSKGQMRVLKALLNTGNRKDQRKLLTHPLVESFLDLKWKTLSTFFYIMFLWYILFVTSLTVYTVTVVFYKDRQLTVPDITIPDIINPYYWRIVVYLFLISLVIQELLTTNFNQELWRWQNIVDSVGQFQERFSWQRIYELVERLRGLLSWRYVVHLIGRSIEFCIIFSCFVFAMVTPLAISVESPVTDGHRFLATLTLMLAFLTIIMLLSKTPMSGYYIQMFWKVSTKIFKILFTFLLLIFMFSLCFMIQFHCKEPFENPWAAFVMTLDMMTSEFNYGDNFGEENATKLSASVNMLRIVFIAFLIFVAIVLMNLMVGVAVDDVQNLVLDGNLRRLDKQVEYFTRLEASREKKSFFYCLGLHTKLNSEKVKKEMKVLPNKNVKCSYNGYIKEAIMNKAQEKFDKVYKEAELNKTETTLVEILKALNDNKILMNNLTSRMSNLETAIKEKVN